MAILAIGAAGASNARRALVFVTCLTTLLVVAAGAQARLEVRVFAHVPAPGYPASALVATDGTVYTGTFKSFTGASDSGPSKVFAFTPGGQLERIYAITGQASGAAHGIQVAATDRAGRLYLLDQAPARVIRLDPRTGAQTMWATFESLPACAGRPNGHCTDAAGGNPPEPDFATWGPDGSLYVTDYTQALVWRIPPGGGKATVWLTDPRLNGIIVGPAGIELMPDRRTLMLDSGGGGADPSTGKLYTLPIEANGQPGALHQIWESAPLVAPDGFAIARSGDIYVSLVGPTGNAVLELSRQGHQIAQVPANPLTNLLAPIPFDAPGSVTFAGNQVIVANQSSILNNTAHMALLEINVGEPGLPQSLPPANAAPPRYTLRVKPARAAAGRRTRFSFSATRSSAVGTDPVVHARVRFAGLTAQTLQTGRTTITATLLRPHSRYRAILIVHGRRVASASVSTRIGAGRRSP
jgi:hypothetical protein